MSRLYRRPKGPDSRQSSAGQRPPHPHQISDNVNIITETVNIHESETTAVTLLARDTTSTRPTRAVPLHHKDSLISTLARIVHTRPERTLVASQADPHAFVPDATHPPSFVLYYNTTLSLFAS